MNIIKAWTSPFSLLCHIPFFFMLLHIPVCLNDMSIIAFEPRFLHMSSSRACEGIHIISNNLWTCNRHSLAYLRGWLDHCHLLLKQPHFFLHMFYSHYWLLFCLSVLIFLLSHFSVRRVSLSCDFWRLIQYILNHYHLLETAHCHLFCCCYLHLYYYHFHYHCFLMRSQLLQLIAVDHSEQNQVPLVQFLLILLDFTLLSKLLASSLHHWPVNVA